MDPDREQWLRTIYAYSSDNAFGNPNFNNRFKCSDESFSDGFCFETAWNEHWHSRDDQPKSSHCFGIGRVQHVEICHK